MVRAATISDLPESLVARILVALASPEPGEDSSDAQELVASQLLARACLVCKRWRQAVYAEPALWRAFTLRADVLRGAPAARKAQWLAASFNLLRRVGQHVEAFSAYDCHWLEQWEAGAAGGWCLVQFLRLLHPHLRALTIHNRSDYSAGDVFLPAATMAVLTSFTQLTALHLGGCGRTLPAGSAGVLQQLAHLQRLRLDVGQEDEPQLMLSCFGRLSLLTYLDFFVGRSTPVDLGQLPRLQHLWLSGGQVEAPGLASLPHLESYALLKVTIEGLPTIRAAAYQAGRLQLDSNFAWAATTRRPLQPAILGALLPPSCGQLSPPTQLQLSCCEVHGGLPACPQLARVAVLQMCDCFTCVGDGAAAEEEEEEEEEEPGQPINEAAAIRLQSGVSRTALSALLQQMPALSEADIEQCLAGDPAVLDCAALPPALTCLSLRGNDLTALPDGPYPPALTDLDLGCNELTRLPPQVLDCTALTRLALDDNEQLVLTFEDARQLLERLPQLTRLELGAESLLLPRVRQALLEGRPGLQLSFTWGDTESEGTSSGSGSDSEDEDSEEE